MGIGPALLAAVALKEVSGPLDARPEERGFTSPRINQTELPYFASAD
jgi:hypothetical protein